MAVSSIRYSFVQRFKVGAREAFKWCTDYIPDDLKLMGARGTRKITRVTRDSIVLTDTYEDGGKSVVKRKLVRLDEKRLWWSSTHLNGPNRYSQFLYRIVPMGMGRSRLEFEGMQLNYSRTKAASKQISMMERRVRREDSNSWKQLATAMERELAQ